MKAAELTDSMNENLPSILVMEHNLEDGLRHLKRSLERSSDGRMQGKEAALVLIKLHGCPLGVVGMKMSDTNDCGNWTEKIKTALEEDLQRHLSYDQLPAMDSNEIWVGAKHGLISPRCQAMPENLYRSAPKASIIVATRERTLSLSRCIASLLRTDYSNFEIVIVDNDPDTEQTRNMLSELYGQDARVLYVRNRRRGLAAAHNAGIKASCGDIIAFTDDDVVVDRLWLREIVKCFAGDPEVKGATGLILPAELKTSSQILLELHGNFSKGFRPIKYDLCRHKPQDRYFPFRAGTLGSGANMAFQRDYLMSVGGFDEALGAGTKARGGDDLAVLCELLLRGHSLAYVPSAFVWHHHHKDPESVRRQAYGYGIGFGAYLTSVTLRQPGLALRRLAKMPTGISEFARNVDHLPDSPLGSMLREFEIDPEWSPKLSRLQLRGAAFGPLAYINSRLEVRKRSVKPHAIA